MKTEVINLIVAVVLSLAYLIGALRAISAFLFQITKPMTQATGILYFGSVLGFGITLVNFADFATGAFHFYAAQDKMSHGIFYWIIFTLISFIFSYVLFRTSFFLIDYSTQENEKAELAKNNITLACVHTVVFIVVCLVVSKPLTDIANLLVSYPKYPN